MLHEEARDHASGRWDTSRYVLDPSACVERFTHTPASEQQQATITLDEPIDAAAGTVSAFTGHGPTGHGETDPLVMQRHAEEQQHAKHASDDDAQAEGLIRQLRAEA